MITKIKMSKIHTLLYSCQVWGTWKENRKKLIDYHRALWIFKTTMMTKIKIKRIGFLFLCQKLREVNLTAV